MSKTIQSWIYSIRKLVISDKREADLVITTQIYM